MVVYKKLIPYDLMQVRWTKMVSFYVTFVQNVYHLRFGQLQLINFVKNYT